jgi:hypothetical protein
MHGALFEDEGGSRVSPKPLPPAVMKCAVTLMLGMPRALVVVIQKTREDDVMTHHSVAGIVRVEETFVAVEVEAMALLTTIVVALVLKIGKKENKASIAAPPWQMQSHMMHQTWTRMRLSSRQRKNPHINYG